MSAYTPSQIAEWEDHVNLPLKFRTASKPALNVKYLTALHIHQISACPYENLLLHYSTSRIPSLDPQALFQKIVTDKRGRGGYCMELSIFFNHILLALGFTVHKTGVRVRSRVRGVPAGDYMGWVHIVNIVTLPSLDRYMVDVGFGGDGATHPLPMITGHESRNLGSQFVRLVHEPITQFSDQSQEVWIYQYRNGSDADWNSFYCFTENEWLPHDFEIMNYYCSTHAEVGSLNFQTQTVLVIRFLKGLVGGNNEEGEEEVVSKVMLVDGVVKRNESAKTRVARECRTEEERREVLEREFGIVLEEEEFAAICGRKTELLEV